MKLIPTPSPNFGERALGKKPSLIVLHYTETPTALEALALLRDTKLEVSAHYLVDDNGSVLRLVSEDKRAWHAGQSSWEGEDDVNSRSVGIEIQNGGHLAGLPPYPDDQMAVVADLCRGIMARWNIPPSGVIAHSDIAPARKKDPGEHFPWKWLAAQGIGIWPEPTPADAPDGTEDVPALLAACGYDRGIDLNTVITAFQRHFVPGVFAVPGQAGTADTNTVQMLKALIRMRKITVIVTD